MELTALGWVFLPAAALIAIRFRPWLPALLVFSTVLQAGSVVNVPRPEVTYGVTPYWVAAAMVVPLALYDLVLRRASAFCSNQQRRVAAVFWLYLGFSAVGAFVLPHLFQGLPVYTLLSHMGFAGSTTPLVFGLAHTAQSGVAILHALVLLYLLQQARRPEWRAMRLLAGVVAAVVLVLVVGAYERLAMSGIVPSAAGFWMSNRGYAQGHSAEVAGVLRMSAPFSEPSYGSVFLAAILLGCLAVASFGRRARAALAAALVVGLGLLNTLGTTGLAAATLGTLFLLGLLTHQAWRAPAWSDPRRRLRVAWGAVVLVLAAGLALATVSPWAGDVQRIFQRGVIEKLAGEESLSTIERRRSNIHALQLVVRTYGFGTGMGSNRASSFFASLLSNVGIVGFGLFVAAVTMLVRCHWRARLADRELFALTACLGATLGVAIGIPDLNLPFYWMLLIVLLVLIPGTPVATRAAD